MRYFIIILFCCFNVFAAGERSKAVLLESIAAVVDGKVILRSELMSSLYQYQGAPGFSQLSEYEQMRRVLDRIIEEKVLLSRVSRDSITVDESELNQRVNSHIKGLAARQNVSIDALEKAIKAQLGISLAQYREKLSEQFRDQILISRIRQKHVGIITPTKKEVEEFYAEYRDSLPRQYDCFLVSRISIPIEPSNAIVDSVKKVANAIIDSLDRGIHWLVLAKNHSQDFSELSGDSSAYIRLGSLEPEYERAALRLGIGEWTETPVKTKSGWHIIRLLGKKDDGIKTSHIFLQTTPSSADSAKTLAKIDSIKTEVMNGKITFASAAKKFSKDKATAYNGGSFGWLERKEIDPDYSTDVHSLEVGGISEPSLLNGNYHIFRLDNEAQVREYNLDEDYIALENMAANYMSNKKLQTLIDGWKNEVYIDIRLQ